MAVAVESQTAERENPLQMDEEAPQEVHLTRVLEIVVGSSASFAAEIADLDMGLDFDEAVGRTVAAEGKHHPVAGMEGTAVKTDYSLLGS